MKKNLAVIGAGGHGKVVGEIAILNNYENVHFFDDAYPTIDKNYPFPIIGNILTLEKKIKNYNSYFIAIGDNKIREEKTIFLSNLNINITNLIHPNATISRNIKLGVGICVMANAVINSGAVIGDGSIINTSSVVDHDCYINNFVHISPNCSLSGGVKIGELTHIGTGSAIHPSIKIGKNVKIGVGNKIFKNIEDNQIFNN